MFEIGQKVVCVKTHPEGVVKEGEVYTLIGWKQSCCSQQVNVGIKSKRLPNGAICKCPKCQQLDISDGYWWLKSTRFRPLDDLFNEEIEELMNEIEELCPS